MNEDLKPIYDLEGDWRPCTSGKDRKIIYKNDKLPSLYRIIDMHEKTISFTDIDRVVKIVDINKVIVKEDDPERNKKNFMPIVNKALDTIRPITMPYVPEKLHAYIESFPGFEESFDDTIGILYFWNKPTKKELDDAGGELEAEMIPCKKFFRIHPVGSSVRYEEISFAVYNEVKTKWMRKQEEKLNVDKA